MINSSNEKFGLCPLMTPGLSKTFGVMYTCTFSKLPNHQIRHQDTHTKLTVNLVIAYIYICLIVTVIYLKDLFECIWINMFTLSL